MRLSGPTTWWFFAIFPNIFQLATRRAREAYGHAAFRPDLWNFFQHATPTLSKVSCHEIFSKNWSLYYSQPTQNAPENGGHFVPFFMASEPCAVDPAQWTLRTVYYYHMKIANLVGFLGYYIDLKQGWTVHKNCNRHRLKILHDFPFYDIHK